MKRLIVLLLLFLAACSNKTDVQMKHVASSQDYRTLTKQQLTAYFDVLPAALNAKDYKRIARYIKPQSEAEKYMKRTILTERFDHYTIRHVTIDDISVKKQATKAVVTRIMSSRATKEQLTKVVTVYELSYDKTTKKMRITDFNDRSVQRLSRGDACVMSGLETECRGLTENELKQSYDKLVAAGTLPKSAITDCLNCAIKDSLAIQSGERAAHAAGPMSAEEARTLVERTYRARVEQAHADAHVTFTYRDSQPAADAGGKYYSVQAMASDQLLQSFKVYLHSHEIIAE